MSFEIILLTTSWECIDFMENYLEFGRSNLQNGQRNHAITLN